MKKTASIALAAFAFSASAHAADLCTYSDATTFLHEHMAHFARPIIYDGVTYARARSGLSLQGYPVAYVFGFDPRGTRRLFPGSPRGTQPPAEYGVVIFADPARAQSELSGYPATVENSPICPAGRTCVQLTCS